MGRQTMIGWISLCQTAWQVVHLAGNVAVVAIFFMMGKKFA
jgi:hypothetical protein